MVIVRQRGQPTWNEETKSNTVDARLLNVAPVCNTQKLCGAYVYLLFMTVALFAFTFTWFRLPETKGRTFDDIAEEFRGADGIPLHNKTGFNTFTWPTPLT